MRRRTGAGHRARRSVSAGRALLATFAVTGSLVLPVLLPAGVTPGPAAGAADPGPPSHALYGWGSNDWGELGNGASGSGIPSAVLMPTPVSGGDGATFASVAPGGAFTVGLTTDGRVDTWGADFVGQLGNGSTSATDVPTPIAVPGGPVTAVAAGSSFALALTANGQVVAWGSNIFGQLGDGTTTSSDHPVAVDAPAGVTFTAIAAGGDHALALTPQGTVYAWGANEHGQLGDGTVAPHDTPEAVPGPPGTTFTAVAAGTGHSLALTSTGTVEAWGFGGSGQLGDGSWDDSDVMSGVALPAGVDVTAVSAGGAQSMALTSQGTVYTWGSDVFGQLATVLVDALPVDSDLPVAPAGIPAQTPFVAVSAGQSTSYAVTANGTVWDWGSDANGQTGNGTATSAGLVPAPLTTLPSGALVADVFAGADSSTVYALSRSSQAVTLPTLGTRTYGDTVTAQPTTTSGLPVQLTASGACWGSLAGITLKAAGTCTLTATQPGNRWFYPAEAATSFTVLPAVLAVNAYSRTVVEGQPIPALGASFTGFVAHDNPSDVTGSPDCTTTATPTSPPGSYPVTCSPGSLSAPGYRFVPGRSGVVTVIRPSPTDSGYALVGRDGSIWSYATTSSGPALLPSFGSMSGGLLDAPVVGGAFLTGHQGYWLVASDGGVFAFGAAGFYGSARGMGLDRPVVGMAETPDGRGYWLVSADGGVLAFGDARFYGSPSDLAPDRTVVGMAATPDGRGYWLVASDGGVFAYGDAPYLGSTGGVMTLDPVVAMTPTPTGLGYWLTTGNGAVFSYGDATFRGSLRYAILDAPVVGMAATVGGNGYWLVGSDGGVFAFGRARFDGTAHGGTSPIVGIL